MRSSSCWATALVVFGTAVLLFVSKNETQTWTRALTSQGTDETRIRRYDLPESADEWCLPSRYPPLNYKTCLTHNQSGIINELSFCGGLTNTMKFVLLGAIMAYEEGRCFTINEAGSHLVKRNDPNERIEAFVNRYLEPIGLDPDDPIVVEARKENRIEKRTWRDVWQTKHPRRVYLDNQTIPSLNYVNMEGHLLKKIVLRRMWRPLPAVRDETCQRLESYGFGSDDFMAFGVRRGDKTLEGFAFTPPEVYIAEAEKAIPKFFPTSMPKIFVATDDCRVMADFRSLRPDWTFVSECDRQGEQQHPDGFVLQDMKFWTLHETDQHYRKFFVELYALAISKYYIGVAYTNVAWWVYFMRPNRWSFKMIDQNLPPDYLNSW